MDDLLQEEDFKIVEPYNPWKYFWISAACIIGGLVLLLFIVGLIAFFIAPNPILVGALILFLPLVVVPLLIFRKKVLLTSSVRDVRLGTLLLLSTFYIPLMIISVLGGNPAWSSIFMILLLTLVPMFIIMGLFKRKLRKQTYQQY